MAKFLTYSNISGGGEILIDQVKQVIDSHVQAGWEPISSPSIWQEHWPQQGVQHGVRFMIVFRAE